MLHNSHILVEKIRKMTLLIFFPGLFMIKKEAKPQVNSKISCANRLWSPKLPLFIFLLSCFPKTCIMKKMIAPVGFYLSFFALAFSVENYAQALKPEDIKAQMVKDWERAKAYTIDYLNSMPADKY